MVNTLYFIPYESEWLCALLNSSTMFWFYTKISTVIRGGGVRFIAQYVSQLPIPSASVEAKVRLAELAEGATKVKGAELAEGEGEINRIVFGLFGLSAEEVALVTGE